MWYMVALKIYIFANSFFMVSIEVCKKALYWQVKRPSAIAVDFSKQLFLTILLTNVVCTGKYD